MYKYLLGTDIETYDFFNLLSFFVLVLFNLANIKAKKQLLSNISLFSRNKIENSRFKNKFLSSYIPWAIVEIISISIVQFAFTNQINTYFGKLVGTGTNYFGLLFITPVILFIFCVLTGLNPLKQIDLITPAFPFALIFTKIACFGAGCCHGAAWENGIYNNAFDRVEFPVQLLEAGCALLLFVFLLFRRKKAKTGTVYPTYLILYCATRFFCEFTKDGVNVLGKNLNIFHILCIIGFIIGIIELLLVIKYNDKLMEFFSKSHKEIYLQIAERFAKNKKSSSKKKKKAQQKNKAKQKKR